MTSSTFNVGDLIRLQTRPPYLKTDDNMPMLRPPDLLEIGAEGTIVSRKPGGYLGIRFKQGTFLLDGQYIEAVESANAIENASETEETSASD
ncbi:MAG: DUF3148 domain-containing protein [Cyanobacteria bacterium J06554_3]